MNPAPFSLVLITVPTKRQNSKGCPSFIPMEQLNYLILLTGEQKDMLLQWRTKVSFRFSFSKFSTLKIVTLVPFSVTWYTRKSNRGCHVKCCITSFCHQPTSPGVRGGVLPYMGYTGICRGIRYVPTQLLWARVSHKQTLFKAQFPGVRFSTKWALAVAIIRWFVRFLSRSAALYDLPPLCETKVPNTQFFSSYQLHYLTCILTSSYICMTFLQVHWALRGRSVPQDR